MAPSSSAISHPDHHTAGLCLSIEQSAVARPKAARASEVFTSTPYPARATNRRIVTARPCTEFAQRRLADSKVLAQRMIRILLVHPIPTRGGFTATVSQAKELCRKEGFEIFVASAPGPRLDELPSACSVEVLHHPLTSLRGMRQLRRITGDVMPDIVHFHGRQAGLIGRLTLKANSRCRVLYTPHGSLTFGSFSRRFAGELVEPVLQKRTEAILCVSHHEVAEWSARDIATQIRYFPNNIWPEELTRENVAGTVGCDSTDWSRTILVPSGYDPMKGSKSLSRPCLSYVNHAPPSRSGAGRADYRDRMVTLAERSGCQPKYQVWQQYSQSPGRPTSRIASHPAQLPGRSSHRRA